MNVNDGQCQVRNCECTGERITKLKLTEKKRPKTKKNTKTKKTYPEH